MEVSISDDSDPSTMEWASTESESAFESNSCEDQETTTNTEEIAKLRDLMPLRTDITFEGCDDSFLLTVLQARRFDINHSFNLLCNFFEFRKRNPTFFTDIKASELRYALEDGFPCVLPYTDSNGSKVMVLFPGAWDIETFAIETIIKTLILSLEYLSHIRKVRQNGIVLLVDFSGWTTNHATKLTIGYLRKVVAVFQCFPVWFKHVHLINQPWYVHAFIAVMKPFMKDNAQDRILLHGNNMSTLHDYIPPGNLPAEFGGNKPEVDQRYWANILLEAEQKTIKKTSTIRKGRNPFRMSIDGLVEVKDRNETECLLSI